MKNPYLNALLAAAYIVLIALGIFYAPHGGAEMSVIYPIAFLSLFTLSAAVMGFLFLARPFQLYIDGQKRESASFFMRTLLTFAGITAIFLVIARIIAS